MTSTLIGHPLQQRPVEDSSPLLRSLQIGMHWFSEYHGGLERYYCDLVENLPEARVEVRGLVCGSSLVERQSRGAVSAAAGRDATAIKRLVALRRCCTTEIETFKPDVICTHFAFYARPMLALIKRKPLVVHFHGPWHAEGKAEGAGPLMSWGRYHIERSVYRRADRLIALSTAFKQILVRDFGVDESRVRVIPGGVDTRRFDIGQTRREARHMLGWPQDRPIILSVRRLTERMGLEDLVRAAALLKARRSEALVVIAGKGHLGDRLKAQIAAAGLENHVKLAGFIPDEELPLHYRAADFSIVPSNSLEGFGLVAVESLAAGTPVIATPVGGLPDIVKPLHAELLCRDSNPESLAETIGCALEQQSTLPGALKCRDYARRFDWSNVVHSIRDVMNEAIGRDGSSI
jgi:glycosyltransferase involved in cell wall biosynthesis